MVFSLLVSVYMCALRMAFVVIICFLFFRWVYWPLSEREPLRFTGFFFNPPAASVLVASLCLDAANL